MSAPASTAGALRDLTDRFMLGLVVWREARGESHEGRVAVAWTVRTRVERPCWWGSDVLSVVSKKWQFSSMTDPKDPQLARWPRSDDGSWWGCLEVASGVLDGRYPNPLPGSDSYHDTSISAPPWVTSAAFVGQLGRLRFFRVGRDHVAAKDLP